MSQTSRKKALIVAAVKKGERNLSKIRIDRLMEYIRAHDLMMPNQEAPKSEYIRVIEQGIKQDIGEKPKRSPIEVQSASLLQNDDLLTELLLRIRVDDLYRLYQSSNKIRMLVTQRYWMRRLEKEHFLLPTFPVDLTDYRTSSGDWKRWYLEVTGYRIAGMVFCRGHCASIGIKTRKTLVDSPQRAPLEGIIQVQFPGYSLNRKGELTASQELVFNNVHSIAYNGSSEILFWLDRDHRLNYKKYGHQRYHHDLDESGILISEKRFTQLMTYGKFVAAIDFEHQAHVAVIDSNYVQKHPMDSRYYRELRFEKPIEKVVRVLPPRAVGEVFLQHPNSSYTQLRIKDRLVGNQKRDYIENMGNSTQPQSYLAPEGDIEEKLFVLQRSGGLDRLVSYRPMFDSEISGLLQRRK